LLAFVALVTACVVAGAVYLVTSDPNPDEHGLAGVVLAPRSQLGALAADAHVLVRNQSRADYGRVAVVADDDPGGPRALTPLRCTRVAYGRGAGMCLYDQGDVVHPVGLDVFDARFRVRHHLDLPGIASRARVAPDGRHGAATVFVSGDSYASASFSTRTYFFDLARGRRTADLEKFRVTRSGAVVDASDRNYWGVTFAADSNTFYATLGTGGRTFLIRGNLRARTAKTIHPDVECPSLSPDGTRVAYKLRRTGDALGSASWRIHVLDLRSGRDVALAERRNVDDQVIWVDNATVGYAIPHPAVNVDADDVLTVPADGSGRPSVMIEAAASPVMVPAG